jgi:drug/metabolite transporter (DMT)-like permease
MSEHNPAAGRRAESPMVGILLMVLAMAVLNSVDAISKLLTADHSGIQITWARYFFHLLPMVLLAGPTRLKRMVDTSHPTTQILRGTALTISALCIIIAFGLMPLADAVAVSFLAPLMIVALSAPFLGEKVGIHRWMSVGIGFVGMLILIWPSGDVIEPGTLFAVGAALFWAIGMLMTRQVRDEDPLTTLFFTALVGAVLMSIPVFFFWKPPSPSGWALMIAMGLLAGTAHILLITAFRHASASLLAPFNYTLLIWATIYGWFLFDELPGLRAIIGATVIVAAGLYAWYRERLKETG